MAISATVTVSTVAVLSATGLGVYLGWRYINKSTLDELKKEAEDINKHPIPGTGKMRKFLLGSKDFGFFYGYAESHVRFVHNRSDGNNVECVFPVAALRTPAATAMIAAFFAAAQVPPPSANRLDLYVSEVQTTLAVVPSAPAQNFKVPEPPKGNTQPSDSPKA